MNLKFPKLRNAVLSSPMPMPLLTDQVLNLCNTIQAKLEEDENSIPSELLL